MVDRAQLDAWMTAAAEGDRAAIDPLFHALWPIVVSYASHVLGDVTLAEDATQDTLVRLFGQITRYDRERDALTWALTLATWECRTVRRRVQRRAETQVEHDAQTIPGASTALEIVTERELVRTALSALASLAERDIEVLVASLTDDDELRQAIAPATFRKRLERALTRLRTSWRSRHGTL